MSFLQFDQFYGLESDSSFPHDRSLLHTSVRRDLKKPIGNPKASVKGLDLGELSLEHWAWNVCGGDGEEGIVFGFFDPSCTGQEGVPEKIFYINGAPDPGFRECSVPKDHFIFVPIFSGLYIFYTDEVICSGEACCSGIEDCCELTEENKNACCSSLGECEELAMKDHELLTYVVDNAELDGDDVSSKALELKASSYPFPESQSCPSDLAVLGYEAESIGLAAIGQWLFIPPLSPGEHTISLAGHREEDGVIDFSLNFDIIVTVE